MDMIDERREAALWFRNLRDRIVEAFEALVVRDGFSYVFVVGGDQRVQMRKVQTGRRVADRVEVLSGLGAEASVAVRGAGFLNDGDLVRVAAPAAAPAAGKQSSSEHFMQKVPVALVDHAPLAINK